MEWRYLDDYTIRLVDRFEEPHYTQLAERIFFGDFPSVSYRRLASEAELARDQELRQRLSGRFMLRIGAFHRDELVGWTIGWQDTDNLFYMASSAILPEHRRRGHYRELLKGVLQRTKEEGFPVVYSRHLAGNNAVIIPKLKAGFVLTGMEVLEWAGTMVRMAFYHSDVRRECYETRVGLSKPSARLKEHLGF
jgi:hypothetical protein